VNISLYLWLHLQDGIGEFFADADTKLYWVSFLDGMQRILLFTDDIAVATVAQQVGYMWKYVPLSSDVWILLENGGFCEFFFQPDS